MGEDTIMIQLQRNHSQVKAKALLLFKKVVQDVLPHKVRV